MRQAGVVGIIDAKLQADAVNSAMRFGRTEVRCNRSLAEQFQQHEMMMQQARAGCDDTAQSADVRRRSDLTRW